MARVFMNLLPQVSEAIKENSVIYSLLQERAAITSLRKV